VPKPIDADRNALTARASELAAHRHAIRSEVFRHRIDWNWLDDGSIEAVLSLTLPDGHAFRFRASADPKEIAEALNALHPEVGGFMGNLWKGVKKVAKTVATSKVFKVAASALAIVAPALGPLAPVAFAAGAGMKASGALVAARAYAAKGGSGNKAKAAKLVEYATNASKVAARAAPPSSAKLAKDPAAAAEAAHLAQARLTSEHLYRLLIEPV
jgi:hypothetical protein